MRGVKLALSAYHRDLIGTLACTKKRAIRYERRKKAKDREIKEIKTREVQNERIVSRSRDHETQSEVQ